jgi:CheY-like chemotaxis protein
MVEIRCPACKADLSDEPLGVTECPRCGSDINVVIDLRDDEEIRIPPSVLVVHHDPEIRRSLITVLEENGFRLAGEVSNGPDAVLVSQRERPDYAVVERFMPAISGEETARLIRGVSTGTSIVSFTDTPDDRPVWAESHLSRTNIGSVAEVLRSLADARSAE